MVRKIIVALIGIIIYAFGLDLMVMTNLGVGPFDSFCLAIASLLNTSLGNAELLVHSIFIVILLIFANRWQVTKQSIIYSFLSIFLISRVIDIMTSTAQIFSGVNVYLDFLIGFFLFTLGIAIYFQVDIIIAPGDKLVVELARVLKRRDGTGKFIFDMIFGVVSFILISGLNLDIALSFTTLFIIVATGPLINFYDQKILRPLDLCGNKELKD